ncbi:MAG: endonuclease III [Sandaracinaceae bacterium]
MAHPEIEKLSVDVHRRLKKAIPAPVVELDHDNPWQLLMATILAAQSTDKKINEISPALFARFPTPEALADADVEEVETLVKQSGFYRNKAKAIMGASRALVERHKSKVPKSIDALVKLPGVARKTANVVIGVSYGKATGIVVDTHVRRVSRKLELTLEEDPAKIEKELMGLFPKRAWVKLGHRMVLHGRYVCQAKKPRCGHCPLNEVCGAALTKPEVRSWNKRAAWEEQFVTSKGTVDVLP